MAGTRSPRVRRPRHGSAQIGYPVGARLRRFLVLWFEGEHAIKCSTRLVIPLLRLKVNQCSEMAEKIAEMQEGIRRDMRA